MRLIDVPTGTAEVVFSASDFAAFLGHPLMLAAAAKAVRAPFSSFFASLSLRFGPAASNAHLPAAQAARVSSHRPRCAQNAGGWTTVHV